MKKYIVYKTTNIVNNKIYIGVHLTDTDKKDTYIGGGVTKDVINPETAFQQAVYKYGYKNFKRETLFEYPYTEEGMESAYAKEAEIVNEEFLKRKDIYNRALGGKMALLSRCKKIAQYTLEGKFIRTYNSIQEALDATGYTSIANVVAGFSKYCGNYQWKYYEGINDDIPPIEIKEKTVYQYDLAGNLLKVWKSATEASKQFDNTAAARTAISNVCCKITRQAYGYYWSHKRKFEYDEYIRSKAVACYDDAGNFIRSYTSLMEAA